MLPTDQPAGAPWPDLAFLTIAQNEEAMIAPCIASTSGVGARHVVLDGGSSDDTVSVARAAGAHVVERPFRYPADQYNFGLSTLDETWVLVLDADERLSPELVDYLKAGTWRHQSVSAFYIARANHFIGTPVRHSGWSPDYNARLLKRADCLYEDREVHAQVEFEGPSGRIQQPIVHLTYTSITQYIRKLNSFTSREVKARNRGGAALSGQRKFSRGLWLRLPCKPGVRFVHMYVLRAGFRDGRTGFRLAVLSAFYEYVVNLKRRLDT